MLLAEDKDCKRCLKELEEDLRQLKGITTVNADATGGVLNVEYDPNLTSISKLEHLARDIGIGITQQFRHETFRLKGLDCPDCAMKIEKSLSRQRGVLWVAVNYAASRMKVEYQAERVSHGEILASLRELGYDLEGEEQQHQNGSRQPKREEAKLSFWKREKAVIPTAASGIVVLVSVVLTLLSIPAFITVPLYTIAIATGGYHVARSGFLTLYRARTLDINFLITVAAVGAAVIGAWAEGAAVVFLFSLANLLESYGADRMRNSVRSLMKLSPNEALVRRGALEVKVSAGDMRIGDMVIVKPGESIPVDGEVVRGSSTVNQAPLTGESMPVEKRVGDEVYAGTINEQGVLEIEVMKLAADTVLSKIIELVEEAQAQKAPSQRFVEKFSRYYTPAVVSLAAGVALVPPFIFGLPLISWVFRGLVLLVVACPCALVLSTPASIVSGIANGARSGVLFKGGVHLEGAGKISVVAFDKTGTLPAGRPEVTDIISFSTMSERQLLVLASAVESGSEHSLATAIVDKARAEGIHSLLAEKFEAIPGKGVRAVVQDEVYYVGKRGLFEELGIRVGSLVVEAIHRLEGEGKTTMLIGNTREIVGIIAARDRIRPKAKDTIQKLRHIGVRKVVMLTGDSERTAAAVAKELDLDEYRAGLLPDDKVKAVRELRASYERVATVGDGVNDAPALAASDVGIAMGAIGADMALETADVALMTDDLSRLPYTVNIGQRTVRNIKQNIVISLLVKTVFFALVFPGVVTLWMAVAADMGTSLAVIANAMRLLSPD